MDSNHVISSRYYYPSTESLGRNPVEVQLQVRIHTVCAAPTRKPRQKRGEVCLFMLALKEARGPAFIISGSDNSCWALDKL